MTRYLVRTLLSRCQTLAVTAALVVSVASSEPAARGQEPAVIKDDDDDDIVIPSRNVATYCRTPIEINPLRDVPPPPQGGQWTVVSIGPAQLGEALILTNGFIRYTPKRSANFYGNVSDSFIVILRDSTGRFATRTINVRTFESISGTFSSLLQPENLVNPNPNVGDLPTGANGLARVTLTRNAAITAKILLEGRTHLLSGPLTGPLLFTKTIALSPGVTRTITLKYDDTTDRWNVRVDETGQVFGLVGNPLRHNRSVPALASRYTVAFAPTTTPDTNGFATMSVTSTGAIALSGEQAWGGSYTMTGNVRVDGVAHLYRSPSASSTAPKQQLLAMVLDFNSTSATSEVVGLADWRFKDNRLGGGLSIVPVRLDVLGSKYSAPASGTPVVGVPGTLKLNYDDGPTLAVIPSVAPFTALTQTGTLALDVFKLTLTRSTGVWSGTLARGLNVFPLRGVTLQTRQEARGFGSTPTLPNGSWLLKP